MDTVRVRWDGGRRFVAADAAGHEVVMDTPAEYGGGGTGMRPLEVALAALAGCTGIDVVSILEKQRQPVEGIEVVVRGHQRDEPPKMYTEIEIEYIVRGDVRPDFLDRAVSLSEDKYCSVRAMLGPDVRLTSSTRILGAAG